MNFNIKFLLYSFLFVGCGLYGAASSERRFSARAIQRTSQALERALAPAFPEIERINRFFDKYPIERVVAALSKDADKRNWQIGRMTQVCFSSGGVSIWRNRLLYRLEEEGSLLSERVTQLCEYIDFNGWHTVHKGNIVLKDRWITLAANQFIATADVSKLRELMYELMFGTGAGTIEEICRRFGMAESFLHLLDEEQLTASPSLAKEVKPFIRDYAVKKIEVEAQKDQPNFERFQATLDRVSEPTFNNIVREISKSNHAKGKLWVLASAGNLSALSQDNPRTALVHKIGKDFYDRIAAWAELAGCGLPILVDYLWTEGSKEPAKSVSDIYQGLFAAAGDKKVVPKDEDVAIPLIFQIVRDGYTEYDIQPENKSLILNEFECALIKHSIKPNVRMFPANPFDERTFFAACVMNSNDFYYAHEAIGSAGTTHDTKYVPICLLLNNDEFDEELRALQSLPAFKIFVEQDLEKADWMKLSESSQQAHIKSIATVALNAQRFQPTLFDRLIGLLNTDSERACPK